MPQRRQAGHQPVRKGRNNHPVQAQQAHVAKRRGHLSGELELGRPAQAHACGTIQHNMYVAIRLALEELDVQFVAAGAKRPIDSVKIVARRVVAMASDLRPAGRQSLIARRKQRAAAEALGV